MNAYMITRQPIDWEKPLPNEQHEKFCQEYLRLDVDREIPQEKARRIEAYRLAFPDTVGTENYKINCRATNLLRNENVVGRLKYLYSLLGTSVESEVRWTRQKAETALLDIILGEEKTENKMKAIDMLNKMRGISTPVVEKTEEEEQEEIDSVQAFFNKLKGII